MVTSAPLLEAPAPRPLRSLSLAGFGALAVGASALLALLARSRDGRLRLRPTEVTDSTFEDAMRALSQHVDGSVFLPGDEGFPEARCVWNQLSAFQPAPLAVVEALSERDVQMAMQTVVALDVGFSVRSGGHSKAGYSNAPGGVMISLKRLNHVSIAEPQPEGALAKLAPGIHGTEISAAALPMGYCSVIGECSNVALGGFILGGGWGIMSRKHGLGLDNLVSARVVLASSEAVEANETHFADLFWALRGAGIGTLGIVTEMTYRLHAAQNDLVCAWDLTVPEDHTAEFLRLVGSGEMPRELHFTLETVAHPMSFTVLWHCPELGCLKAGRAFIRDELGSLVKGVEVNISPCVWKDNSYPSENTMLVQSWAGFLKPVNVTEAILKTIVDTLYEWTTEMNVTYVMPDMELWGGRISDFPADSTAFPHRDAVYNVAVVVEVPLKEPDRFQSIVNRLDREWHRVSQFLDGSYINYQQASLSSQDYPTAYWGSNLLRLQAIKRKYDPKNLFTYTQGIPMA